MGVFVVEAADIARDQANKECSIRGDVEGRRTTDSLFYVEEHLSLTLQVAIQQQNAVLGQVCEQDGVGRCVHAHVRDVIHTHTAVTRRQSAVVVDDVESETRLVLLLESSEHQNVQAVEVGA